MLDGKPPPGPRGTWFGGCLGEFRRDMLGLYTCLAREHGDCVGFRLGPRRLCLVNHPDLIEYVLTAGHKHFTKLTYVARLLIPTIGHGLLTSEGDFWLRQRRLMQPMFQKHRVASYGNLIVEYAQRQLAEWHDGETRDIHHDMMTLALSIVAKALFGADVHEAVAVVEESLNVIMDTFIKEWESWFPLPKWVPTPQNRRRARAVKNLEDIIYRFIHARRAEPAASNDLLSRLLHARDEADKTGMTDLQLRDEVMTLFLAGHETTANALSWTWYLLSQHPEVVRKIQEEVQGVLNGRAVTGEDLGHLRYTEAVAFESMRLYPPVYAFGRQALEDLALHGFKIAKGTTVIMSQWVTHRDERFFPNASAFQPERWLGESARSIPHFAYFPFGGGQRMCIGNHFAVLEMVMILATLVPRVRMTLAPGQEIVPKPYVTLRPAHGMRMVIEKTAAT